MGPVPPGGSAPTALLRFVPKNVRSGPLLATDRMGEGVPVGLPEDGPTTATVLATPAAPPPPLGAAPTLTGTGDNDVAGFATPYGLSSESYGKLVA